MAGASFARRQRRRWASGAYPARRKTNSGAMINSRVGSAIPAGCVRTRLFAIGALRPGIGDIPGRDVDRQIHHCDACAARFRSRAVKAYYAKRHDVAV